MARRQISSPLRLTKYLTSAAGFCIALFARDSSGQTFTNPPYTVPYHYANATYNWIAQAQPNANTSYVFYCRDTEGEPTVDFNQQLGDATQFYLRFGGSYAWSSPGYCLLMHTDTAGTSWNLNIVVDGYFIFGTPEVNSFRQFRSHREFKYNGFPYDEYSNSNFGVSGIRTGDILIPGSSFAGGPNPPPIRLTFPLQSERPDTVARSAILDHSGDFYKPNGTIAAFNGETGKRDYGAKCYTTQRGCLWGYKKEDGSPSNIPGLGPYLWYDGHSGYDYPKPSGTVIQAAAGGTLCAATRLDRARAGRVWRNPSQCPFGHDPINGPSRGDSWTKWAAFYIVHEASGYTTWYLHSSALEPSVQSQIVANGYAVVDRAQPIAYVGDTGVPGAFHLHFEVRKGDAQVIDPYGWQADPRLWLD